MVVQCCVCKRVRVEDAWARVPNPEAVARTASHGYCPTCLADLYAEFREWAQAKAQGNVPPAA